MKNSAHLSSEQSNSLISRTRYLSLVVVGFALATAVLFFLIFQNTRNWQVALLAGSNLLVMLVALWNIVYVSRGKIDSVWRMTMAVLLLSGLLSSFLIAGMGLLYGLLSISLAMAAIAQMPRGHAPRWVHSFAVVGGAVIYAADIYWPLERFFLQQPWLVYQYIILGISGLLCAIFSFYRFGSRSLRLKLVVMMGLMGLVTALPVASYLNWSNRQTLIERENTKLLNAAEQVALNVDQFIDGTLRNVEMEASFSDLSYYLTLPPDRRASSGYEERTQRVAQLLASRTEDIVSYAILDSVGTVLIDSSAQDLRDDFSQAVYFVKTVESVEPQISSVLFETNGDQYNAYLYFTAPIIDSNGLVVGVLRAKYHASVLQDIISGYNDRVALTSFATLVNENNLRLAHGRDTGQLYQLLAPLENGDLLVQLQNDDELPPGTPETIVTPLQDLAQKLTLSDTQPVFTTYVSEDDAAPENTKANAPLTRVAVYSLKSKPWKVIFSQEETITLQPLQRQARVVGALALLVSALVVLLSLGLSNMFLRPALRLTDASAQIAQGNLDVTIPVKNEDEFGLLSRAFNDMTAQVRQSVSTLETRVIERTRDLELRAFQLQVAAETGSIVATIRDVDKLLPEVADLLNNRFGFYHVGIFLLDEAGEYVVLRASNSQGGHRMLERGHRLQVGATSIVGHVVATGQARISMNVGDDTVFFNNPDLPNTRSEMALPLIVRNRAIGVLDLQSDEENDFSEADVTILRVVADQVAIAIENARLFVDLQTAIEATRRAYGEVTARAWLEYGEKQNVRGYLIHSADIISPVAERPSDALARAIQDLRSGSVVQLGPHTLAVPIKFRDLVLGAIRLQKDASKSPWVDEEIVSIQNLADQIGAALENARLYRETQRAASRDRMVREIGDKMRRAPDMDALIQTAVREMARTLGVTEAFAQISVDTFSTVETPAGNGSTASGETL